MQPTPPKLTPPARLAAHLMYLNQVHAWEAQAGVPLLLQTFGACAAWPASGRHALLISTAYGRYLAVRMSCERFVYRSASNLAAVTPRSLAANDIRMGDLATALGALQNAVLAGSEACYQWALERAKTVATEDFGNQLRSAQDAIVAAKAVAYTGTTVASAVGTLVLGPLGGAAIGLVAALATYGQERVARSKAISTALKNPVTVADLAGRASLADTAAARTGQGSTAATVVGELSSVGSAATSVAEVGPALLGPGLGFASAALAPFTFLGDASEATKAPAAPVAGADSIATAVRLSWQSRTGTTVKPGGFQYLGFSNGCFCLLIDGQGYLMNANGVVVSQLEVVAREALALAASLPCDTSALIIDWLSMRFTGRIDKITYCFAFTGNATFKGHPVTVDVCVDPEGNWFAGPPNADDLLASSVRPSLPEPSLLLPCADADALDRTGLLVLCLRKSPNGRYQLNQQEDSFEWLSDAEKAHVRALVDKHNASQR